MLSEKFISEIEDVVKIVLVKYPKEDSYCTVFLFVHSNCHGTYAEDALNTYKINAKPGGKQPRMRDTVWQGNLQRMVYIIGIPKGLEQVLAERGVNTNGMKLEDVSVGKK